VGLSSELEGRGKGISVRGVGLFLWRRGRGEGELHDILIAISAGKNSSLFQGHIWRRISAYQCL